MSLLRLIEDLLEGEWGPAEVRDNVTLIRIKARSYASLPSSDNTAEVEA